MPLNPRTLTASALLAALVLLTGCASGPPKPFVPTTMTPELRAAAFKEVGELIEKRYFDGRFNGVDWTAVQVRYRDQVLNAPTDEAFWAALNRMTGELRDAHTRVLTPMEQKATREQRGFHGLDIQQIGGRWLLAGVAGYSQAALLGARPGHVVLEIDGQPVDAWWASQANEVRGSSTPRSQHTLINRALNGGAVGSQRRLLLQREDGSNWPLTLRQDALQNPEVRTHLLVDGTGYLRLGSFNGLLTGEVTAAIKRLEPAQRLVLDLRSNSGGAHKLTMQLLGHLLPPGKAGQVLTRDNQRITALLGLLDVTPNLDISAQQPRLTQPLAVLINGDSASAAELTSGVLQAQGRARLFGATTCGCLLATRGGEALPGDGRLIFSEVDLLIAGRGRVEGVGVTPDVPVAPDPGASLRGFDPVLTAALQWLREQAPAKP